LLKTAAGTLITIAAGPKHLGARIGLRRTTVATAITTGSTPACGIDPCAPSPNRPISGLSADQRQSLGTAACQLELESKFALLT